MLALKRSRGKKKDVNFFPTVLFFLSMNEFRDWNRRLGIKTVLAQDWKGSGCSNAIGKGYSYF